MRKGAKVLLKWTVPLEPGLLRRKAGCLWELLSRLWKRAVRGPGVARVHLSHLLAGLQLQMGLALGLLWIGLDGHRGLVLFYRFEEVD